MRLFLIIATVAVWLAGAAFATPAAAQPPTPTPSTPSALVLDEKCTPTTFRPDEWVVVDCIQRVTNNSSAWVFGAYTMVERYEGTIPSYYVMWSRRADNYLPVPSATTSYPGFGLGPGETSEMETAVLFKMPQGKFSFDLGVFVNDEMVTSQTIVLDAEPGAAAPPAGPLIAEPIFSIASDGTSGEFDVRITNSSKSGITALTLTDRLPDGILIADDPKPAAAFSDVSLMQWDLSSFGKKSLAPGESLLLKMTHGLQGYGGCGVVSFGLVVRATVDGEERLYGREVAQSWGDCPEGGEGGGGFVPSVPPTGIESGIAASPATDGSGTQAITAPRSGEGNGATTRGLGTLAEALAVAGVLLTVLGHAARRVRY